MALPWFIFITVALLFLLAVIYERNGLKALSYTRYFSTKVAYEGDNLEMIEEIVNAKLLPLPWLRLESSIARGWNLEVRIISASARVKFIRIISACSFLNLIVILKGVIKSLASGVGYTVWSRSQ